MQHTRLYIGVFPIYFDGIVIKFIDFTIADLFLNYKYLCKYI